MAIDASASIAPLSPVGGRSSGRSSCPRPAPLCRSIRETSRVNTAVTEILGFLSGVFSHLRTSRVTAQNRDATFLIEKSCSLAEKQLFGAAFLIQSSRDD